MQVSIHLVLPNGTETSHGITVEASSPNSVLAVRFAADAETLKALRNAPLGSKVVTIGGPASKPVVRTFTIDTATGDRGKRGPFSALPMFLADGLPIGADFAPAK